MPSILVVCGAYLNSRAILHQVPRPIDTKFTRNIGHGADWEIQRRRECGTERKITAKSQAVPYKFPFEVIELSADWATTRSTWSAAEHHQTSATHLWTLLQENTQMICLWKKTWYWRSASCCGFFIFPTCSTWGLVRVSSCGLYQLKVDVGMLII